MTTDRTLARLLWTMIAVSLAVELFASYSSAFTLVDPDPFVMGEVARRVLDGETLYREAWDNKPPLALLFYAPAQFVVPMSYMAHQLFGALWTALQALLAYALLGRESALARSVAASLVLLLPFSRPDFAWASSENAVNMFTLPLTLIAYCIARRRSWHTWELSFAGALAVLAFHCRQPGILLGLPVGMFVLFGPQRAPEKMRGLAALAAGALAGIALILAIVLLVGDVASYLQAVFVGPQRFVASQVTDARWAVLQQVLLLRHHPYIPMTVFALVIAGTRGERTLIAAVAATSVLAVLAPLREWGHYQEQLVPLLVLSAVIAVRALEGVSRPAAAAYGVALVVFYVFNAMVTAYVLRPDDGEMAELDEVARVIEASNAATAGTVLAIGRNSAYVYFRTRVTPVHKYHWDLFFDADGFLPESPADVVRAIIAQPPTWLAVDAATLVAGREGSATTRREQLVQALCGVRACDEVARTRRWHVLRIP
jgi:hypothetical protein